MKGGSARKRKLPIEPAQALQLAGLVAAMVLAAVVNVLSARHFTRWDWTTAHRLTTDAVVIVASGDQHWFLTTQDLFEPSDETHVRPSEERALTQAIRHVLGGERAKLEVGDSLPNAEAPLDAGCSDFSVPGGDTLAAVAIVPIAEGATEECLFVSDGRPQSDEEIQRDQRSRDGVGGRDRETRAHHRRPNVQGMGEVSIRSGRGHLSRLVQVSGCPDANRFTAQGDDRAYDDRLE